MRADTYLRRRTPSAEQVDIAVEVFRMLSDATRVQLLWALIDGEQSVTELAAATDKPPAGISQHLAKLRMARLVRPRRQGTHVYYRIDSDHVQQLVEDAIYHAEHSDAEHSADGIPAHHRGASAPAARTITRTGAITP